MKKFGINWVLIAYLFLSPQLYGQVNVNVNIGSQPAWGPVGYDHVEFYYLPDVQMYYSVPFQKYIYFERGRWVWVSQFPDWHPNFDIYTAYKVVINEQDAYLQFDKHKVKYARYKNCQGAQQIIKDSKRSKNNNNNSASLSKGKGKSEVHRKQEH